MTAVDRQAAPAARLCLFTVGELCLGIEVTVVQEVTERLPLTVVPMSPAGVRGVANLRGQLVTALDLPALLGLPAEDRGDLPEAPVDVIVRAGPELVGLPVDAVADVLEAPPSTRTGTPANLTGPVRELVRAVHVLDRRLVLELDVPALIDAARSGPPTPLPAGSSPS